MTEATCPTPVVLLVFNRPALTAKLLARLREVRPTRVLIVADGPRPERTEDAEACAEVRHLLDNGIDWPAEVLRDYAPANLGLRRRVSSGLTWAFQHVERAIVLEDDCLPHPSFFRFCSELLARYEHDNRVGVITGDNFQPQPFDCTASYYFSRYPHCWGWATWRRAWKLFDAEMENWPALRDAGWLEGIFPDPGHARYWRNVFEKVHQRQKNSWAYAWTFSCWSQNLLTTIPRVNLVSNLGFGAEATHTGNASNQQANLPSKAMEFPLRHPSWVTPDHRADAYSQRELFGSRKAPRRTFSLRAAWRRLAGQQALG